MTGTNQFVPFATGPGANTRTPTAWAASSLRANGFNAGIAPSIDFNTAWRSPTFMSAMLGAFMAIDGNVDALDNGDVDDLRTNYKAALRAWLISVLGDILDGYFLEPGSAARFNTKLLLLEAMRGVGVASNSLTTSWVSRVMNSTIYNEVGAPISSGIPTLPVGRYRGGFAGIGWGAGGHQARLYNITGGVEIGHGLGCDSYTGGNVTANASGGMCKFVLTTPSQVAVQHRSTETIAPNPRDGDDSNASNTIVDAYLFLEREIGTV